MDKDKVGAVLVVGGGIAGIQTSLDLANSGFKVYLLEDSPAIGGTMAQLDKTFPTNDCAMCIMSPKLVDCGRHHNIELISCAELTELTGEAGNFHVKIFRRPRYIDIDKCTGCGECEKACPVEVASEFEEGIVNRKAAFRLFPQAYPNAFAIDKKRRPPCQVSCPAGVHVQGYVALIREKKYYEAYELIRRDNPFVSICGRVCHHPCEDNCRRGEYDEPIAIASLKRFIADRVYKEEHPLPEPVEITSDKTVGIVGAGPSGLTCAMRLRDMGYAVTVYDEADEPGGMLTYCLPEYRIPKEMAMQDIERMLASGFELKSGTKVGKNVTLEELKERHDAVYVAVGFQAPARLFDEFDESNGVLLGLDFLRRAKKGAKVRNFGKRIVVIGGGNVAMDCARTAIRLGAEEVNLMCLETRDLESKDRMPAHVWEIEEAEEEDISIHDRLGPRKIITENGRVIGVKTMRCTSVYKDDGSFAPVFDDNEKTEIITADTVVIAIGQRSALDGFEMLKSNRGIIEANAITLETSVPGFFAGGDIVTGPASIVEAVHHGNEAAISISRYLEGENIRAGRKESSDELPLRDLPEFVEKKPRAVMPAIAAEKRVKSFVEFELGFTEEQAIAEAERCLECGLCSECLECERVCEADAVVHSMLGEYVDINVGAIILATGAEKFDPSEKYEFGYGKYKNVVTSIQLERILSASGPFAGHVQRPSDGKVPKRIAWIQCVGSRDELERRKYCSSVCCMYAIKEAVIAREHVKEVEPTIFYMDIRAYGKDFDAYYDRAKDEYGVRFVRSRVGKVVEMAETENLMVYYTTENGGGQVAEEFNMVVLSVGLEPNNTTADLAERLGVRLNKHEFFKTSSLSPIQTSRPGIFVCGPASSPKDIPETVMQASGAVTAAESILAEVRGTEIVPKIYPPERDVSGESPRIGVFVCHCGINIGSVVDVPAVVEYAKTLPDVVHAEDNLFTCSQDTQEKIKEMIHEHGLNRVIVASCTPRTHEPLFQETLRESGLNPRLFEMVNIRDQCSWVHRDVPDRATEKAKHLVRMAVGKSRLLEPLHTVELSVTQKALVIGGGLAGMVSALSIAEQGFEVVIVERENELGGNLRNLYYTAAGEDVQEYLNSLIEKVENNPRIKVLKGATVENIEGYIGNYKTTIATENRESKMEIEHGIVVVATGAEESKPKEYLYGEDERVITQLELEKRLVEVEKILETKGKKPISEIQKLKSVVMIQCVGSRDDEHPYCSRVCCQEAVKNAIKLRKLNPKTNIYVLYRDIRTYGFFEEYYQKARDDGVVFIRYEKEEKPVVEKNENGLEVKVRDIILGSQLIINPDLVVLAPAIIPRDDAVSISQMLKVPLNENKFFLEAHVKLRPVDFATEGVFLAGLAHSPKTIDESISQAKAAAARACTIISKDKYEAEATISSVNEDICAGCGVCVSVCPYDAPELITKGGRVVSHVNEALCKGCGSCACACPSGAIEHLGFKVKQTLAMLEAALR